MFRVFSTANIFLGIVIFKMTTSDQESMSNANCQLTNTCFGRTTDDLEKGKRQTTPKITDKQTSTNTPTTLTTSENAAPLATHSPISLQAVDAPSTEATCSSKTTQESNAALQTTTPISTATKLTKVTNRKSQATAEVAEESTVAMTTVDALISTYDSEPSEEYTISSVWKFDPFVCNPLGVVKVNDLIYVLCAIDSERIEGPWLFAILAYEDNIPHDLLMITIIEEIEYPRNLVGIENTNLFYVHDWQCSCIWKIDTVNNTVDKWMSDVGLWCGLSVANDNHILVLKDYKTPKYLEIYDQDAKVVRRISLPNNFRGPSNAIQKPNGEFIVSHYLKANYKMCISFLSADGQIISQLMLKEAVLFYIEEDITVTLFDTHVYSSDNFATDMVSGKVYMAAGNWDTRKWIPTDLSLTISNDSGRRSRKIVGLRNSDGRIIEIRRRLDKISVWLSWDADNNNLLMSDDILDYIHLFDTKTLKWSRLGRLENEGLYYETKKKQFITIKDKYLHIWTLSKN